MAGPGEAMVERRLIAVTSNGIVLVFTKDGEGLLGDVAAPGEGEGMKDKSSGFGLRSVMRCDLPKDVAGVSPQIRSVAAFGKVGARACMCSVGAMYFICTSIAAQGFVLGGSHGFFAVYEKTDDKKEPFMHIKTFKQGVCTWGRRAHV